MADINTYDRKTALEIDQKIAIMMSLNEQRKTNKYTDITLECRDGKLDAHRNILSACPYFEAMFSSGMLESNSKNVHFKNATANAMKIIVSYLYGSDIPPHREISEPTLREAVQLADMMSLIPLFAYLWDGLIQNYLRKDNFIEMWNLAELHNQTPSFMTILHFVQENFDAMEEELIHLLSPIQMQFLLSNSEASDKLFKLLLDWGSVSSERADTLVLMLNDFDMKKLSTVSFVMEYLIGKQSAFNERTKRLIMTRLEDVEMHKKPQLHVNVISNVTTASVQLIEKFCLRQKKWLKREKISILNPSEIRWYPAISQSGEIFRYGNTVLGEQVMYVHKENRFIINSEPVDADTYTDLDANSVIAHRNFLYVWCGWYCVFEFNTDTNQWSLLPIINYEYGSFDGSIAHLAVRHEKLYFSVCSLDISTMQMYELREDLSAWDLKLVKMKKYLPIKSKCFGVHDCCKLYFEWTKGNKFHLVTFDVVSEEWVEKQIPIAAHAVFGVCDQDFVIYQLNASPMDLFIYYCVTDKWEKLPLPSALHLSILATEEDCLIDVC